MSEGRTEVTRLLRAIQAGQGDAGARLATLLYGPLRRLARHLMQAERPGHTLPPTALVHEAWLRLVSDKEARWENRAHFFDAAASAMRRILVDYARRRGSARRGGGMPHVALDSDRDVDPHAPPDARLADVEALDAALAKMEADEEFRQKCAVVKLRCFAGLTVEETARVLRTSTASVKRDWTFAKAWLYREMTRDRQR